jgi:hypothetical protein
MPPLNPCTAVILYSHQNTEEFVSSQAKKYKAQLNGPAVLRTSDVLRKTIEFLDLSDYARIKCVCHSWNEAIDQRVKKAIIMAIRPEPADYQNVLLKINLFTPALSDIHNIPLGFFQYNLMLMSGYLPVNLHTEKAYGNHLATNEIAMKELEEHLEEYLNVYLPSVNNKILFLLNSYNTSFRLIMPESAKKRLQDLYGKALCVILGEKEINIPIIQDASLFLNLYFESFKKRLSTVEMPLSRFYPKGVLTRLFGEHGNAGFAFVMETSSIPAKSVIKEQLRKSLSVSPALRKIVTIFIPDDTERAKFLDET